LRLRGFHREREDVPWHDSCFVGRQRSPTPARGVTPAQTERSGVSMRRDAGNHLGIALLNCFLLGCRISVRLFHPFQNLQPIFFLRTSPRIRRKCPLVLQSGIILPSPLFQWKRTNLRSQNN
jgi:hypothetical protein